MDNPSDIFSLCRLCLVKDQVNISIFDEQGDIRQIFLKISSCLPIKVSRDDKLPKKICDDCSNKLDLLYEFWNSSANAEKTLLSWLGQAGVKDAGGTINAVAQQIAKPTETLVKLESGVVEGNSVLISPCVNNVDNESFNELPKEESEAAPPPPKRTRRSAAVKAQINIIPESEDDDDIDTTDLPTKLEDGPEDSDAEDKDPSYTEVPGTSANDQPGPSGVGKAGGVEAPICPMAFFTPIVQIAERSSLFATGTKDNKIIKKKIKKEKILIIPMKKTDNNLINKKNDKKDTNKTKKTVPKNKNDKTKEKPLTRNNKRKRDRSKSRDNSVEENPEKLKRKNSKKNLNSSKKEKNPKGKIRERKQQSPKKNNPKKINEIIRIKCEETDNVLITPEQLDLENSKVIKCPICKDEKDWNLKAIREHYKEIHPGKRLRTSRYFGDVLPCDICAKEFRSPCSLKEHIETHNNYFYCDVCNHSTRKFLDHIIHLRVHNDDGIFQCLMCEFKTIEINQIKDHVTNHNDLLKYWCAACKKSFNILQHFQEHDNYHTGLKPFCCTYCGKCFLYSRYLHAHKLNLHKEEISCPKIYQCVICHKIYQHRNSLKLHMNSHTGNYEICDICGKTLSSKEKLKFHLRTHTGYKPFSCQYCGKCFTKKPLLVEHVRIHTGEKPYICEFCCKGFSQRSSLVIHMRGHTGEKPYICQICSKGFAAKAMLNLHLKTCKGFYQVAKLEL